MEAPFAVAPADQPSNEFSGYVSLYREALSSSSTVYSFLCLYKIIEGLRARVEHDWNVRPAAPAVPTHLLGKFPNSVDEIVRWLNALFPVHRDWDRMCLEGEGGLLPMLYRESLTFDFPQQKALRACHEFRTNECNFWQTPILVVFILTRKGMYINFLLDPVGSFAFGLTLFLPTLPRITANRRTYLCVGFCHSALVHFPQNSLPGCLKRWRLDARCVFPPSS